MRILVFDNYQKYPGVDFTELELVFTRDKTSPLCEVHPVPLKEYHMN